MPGEDEKMMIEKTEMQKELSKKNILIAGGGRSGVGAAILLAQRGIGASLYDGNEALDCEAILKRLPDGASLDFVLGSYKEETADRFDLLILSPGISVNSPIARSFTDRNKPVWGEVELAWCFAKGHMAAITGTNGKTTTTALVGEILKEHFKKVFVVGNIGTAFTSVANETTDDCAIAAEISSFQLETISGFCPDVSAVLNVTPDHLDRHGTMEVYADAKLAISKNQTKDQVIILNYDDPITRAMAERTPARPVFFSRKDVLEKGIFLEDDSFVIRKGEKIIKVCRLDEIQLLGSHNHENILAAIGISYYMGVDPAEIRRGVMNFKAVEHRIEYVDTVDGVDYYNDSKGTNPDAAIKGIQAMTKPTVLLGGGYDKKSSYDEWIDAFDGKVQWLILMGATAEAIAGTAREHGFENIILAESFEQAMDLAREKARPGDAVLLSPACASWGMFKNYEVRGQVFKEIVRKFKG